MAYSYDLHTSIKGEKPGIRPWCQINPVGTDSPLVSAFEDSKLIFGELVLYTSAR